MPETEDFYHAHYAYLDSQEFKSKYSLVISLENEFCLEYLEADCIVNDWLRNKTI